MTEIPIANPYRKPFTLEVQQKHLTEGICKSPSRCAVAKALMDHFDGMSDLKVSSLGVYVTHANVYMKDGDSLRIMLPEDLRNYIVAFDKHFDLKPRAFEITEIKPL